MRYAMVDTASGIVVNVIEWDGDEAQWRAPTGYTMVESAEAGPGFTYDGETFTPPPGGLPSDVLDNTLPEPGAP